MVILENKNNVYFFLKKGFLSILSEQNVIMSPQKRIWGTESCYINLNILVNLFLGTTDFNEALFKKKVPFFVLVIM